MPIQFKRGTNADRTSIMPASGEPLWTTDTKNFYVGDGITAGGILIAGSGDVTGPSSSTNNHVVFFSGTSGKVIKDSGLTLSGTNTGDQTITFTAYGDATGTSTSMSSLAPSLTITGIMSKPIPALSTGFLKYDGTNWVFDNSGYITTAVTSISFSGTGLTPSTGSTGTVNVNGTLNVSHGGTGATTLSGVVLGTGTSAMTTAAIIGSSDIQILRTGSGGTSYAFIDFKSLPQFNATDQGLVPAATSGVSPNLFLASDNTWRKIDTSAIANQSARTLLANTNPTTGAVSAVPIANITTELNTVVGDSGSGGTKGIVPTPPAGAAAAGKVLSAGGTFAVPTHYDGGSRI
jgi:hypothetical protein